jgi:hypothetical protein
MSEQDIISGEMHTSTGHKFRNLAAGFLLILLAQGRSFPQSQSASNKLAMASASNFCPPLPAPTGSIIDVHNEQELWDAANNAASGTTILIADGTYHMAQNGYYLWLDTPNVTLRSKSGNRGAVVLDDDYAGTETITIAASNVTVADLTIQRAHTHPIHVVTSPSGASDTLNALIYNVHIIDPGQQAVKINNDPTKNHYVDNGTVACSQIELTPTGQAKVLDINNGTCYTGGIDAHQARGWTFRDNLIEGFWCQTGLSEHAIHAWTGSRDTLVERNQLVNDARGVGFGLQESGSGRSYNDNPCPSASGYVDHYGGIIRNNFVYANDAGLFASESGFDSGIALAQACDAQVLHNTVVSTQTPNASSIEWRFANTSAQVTNNLTSYRLWARDGATATLAGNLSNAPLSLFTDAASGDLHLLLSASAAIDQGATLPAGICDDDIDGDPRPLGSGRDIGADEFRSLAPAAVRDLYVRQANLNAGQLTISLGWTSPSQANLLTLRYFTTPVTDANWNHAIPFSGDLPGGTGSYTSTIPYSSSLFFALRSQATSGEWSAVSNNAFWPQSRLYLPHLLR